MKFLLDIANETILSGRSLRKFLLAGIRAVGAEQLCSEGSGRCFVRIYVNRGEEPAGYSYRDPIFIGLGIPGPWLRGIANNEYRLTDSQTYRLAQIFMRELHHSLGLRRMDMVDPKTLDANWCVSFSLCAFPGYPNKL